MIFFLPTRTGDGNGYIYCPEEDILKLKILVSILFFIAACVFESKWIFGFWMVALMFYEIFGIFYEIFRISKAYVSAPHEKGKGDYDIILGGRDFTINSGAINVNTPEAVDKINKLEDEKPITEDRLIIQKNTEEIDKLISIDQK